MAESRLRNERNFKEHSRGVLFKDARGLHSLVPLDHNGRCQPESNASPPAISLGDSALRMPGEHISGRLLCLLFGEATSLKPNQSSL